jgi:hypothetical protein
LPLRGKEPPPCGSKKHSVSKEPILGQLRRPWKDKHKSKQEKAKKTKETDKIIIASLQQRNFDAQVSSSSSHHLHPETQNDQQRQNEPLKDEEPMDQS